MRGKRGLGIVAAVALAVGTGGASLEVLAPEFGGALPLWQPEGSPVVLLPGAVMYPPIDMPRAMAVADVTGDGRAELIVGGDYLHVLSLRDGEVVKNYLTVFVGVRKLVGPGGVRLGVRALAAGDMDGDGLTDLVVATNDGMLWVLRNHAQRGFQWGPGSPYPVNGDHLWLFDHDGDGHPDVVLGRGSEVVLLRNTGTGRLGEPGVVATLEGRLWAGQVGIYAGKPGLFLLTERGLWFLEQGGQAAERVLDRGGWGLAVGKFTRSGKDDVAISRDWQVEIYPGGGEGLGEPVVLKLHHIVARLLAGDLNGDGFTDLVVGCPSPGGFAVFYNRLGQAFLGPYWHGVDVPAMGGLPAMADLGAVGDLTGDGRDDIVVVASLGHIAFFHTEPRGRSLQAIPGSFLLGSADVNGDGYIDVLVSTTRGGVAALVNSGWGTFTPQDLVGPSGDYRTTRMPFLVALGDVTGDGEDELVVWEFGEDSIVKGLKPGKKPWEPSAWELETSRARITVWNLQSPKEPLWSMPTGKLVRHVLVLFDLDGDGVRDGVTVVGTTLLGLNFDPATRGEPPDFGMKRTVLDMLGMVGPVALVRLADGERLAALRLGKRTELLLVRPGGAIEETGVSLEIAPLGLTAADLDRDGNEDLAIIGWGAGEQDGQPTLFIVVAVLFGDGKGGFTPELFPLEDWPPLALPFPYRGLVAADLDGDGKPELAAMRLPDKEGNPGGIVVIPWTEGGPGKLVFLPGCVGTELLALDLDGDGRAELLSVHAGTPAWLCITRWR